MSEEQKQIEEVLSNKKDVRNVILEELEEDEVKGKKFERVEKLGDVELPVRVEFARIEKRIEEVLEMSEGDIVKLNRFAGELVDIFVGERLFAKGEITVVDDKFGVRVVEILPGAEKIE